MSVTLCGAIPSLIAHFCSNSSIAETFLSGVITEARSRALMGNHESFILPVQLRPPWSMRDGSLATDTIPSSFGPHISASTSTKRRWV